MLKLHLEILPKIGHGQPSGLAQVVESCELPVGGLKVKSLCQQFGGPHSSPAGSGPGIKFSRFTWLPSMNMGKYYEVSLTTSPHAKKNRTWRKLLLSQDEQM